MKSVRPQDVFGLLRPAIDAHTLGLIAVAELLQGCGLRAVIADSVVCAAAVAPQDPESMAVIKRWLAQDGITRLGFSYRLDPREGAEAFGRLVHHLRAQALLEDRGGPIRGLYFAGLPQACALVKREHGDRVEVFSGDETPGETLERLGVARRLRPREVTEGIAYDDARLQFGTELLRRERHLSVTPVDRSGYAGFGGERDRLVTRLRHSRQRELPPLMRAHAGPYLPDRAEAVQLFLDWARDLAGAGLLDVLSIGTSQLSQSNFGDDWGGKPNGGGVPINSPEEFRAVWEAARPMLVRTYAGTRDIPQLARLYEETINIAWHALSLWWFCQLDGRGPYSVRENLQQHLETIDYVARSGKPFEPNVPHHFAFRGADDITYIVSAALAARTAKARGVRYLVLQNMLNTPKSTWGVQDLAKSRAMLRLVRELEDGDFGVILQPRAGLDYFSTDLDKAKAQLAAATALMDDIEPHHPASPPMIHVVSYSEAARMADPAVINESIQITRAALVEYRRMRERGAIDDMSRHPDVQRRTEELLEGARTVLGAIESAIAEPYTAEGLYRIFAAGFLPAPYLWARREEFPEAVRWRTSFAKGGVQVVDEAGRPVAASHRAAAAAAEAARRSPPAAARAAGGSRC